MARSMIPHYKNESFFALFILRFVYVVSVDERKAGCSWARVVSDMINPVYCLRGRELLVRSGCYQQRTKIVKDNS